MKVSDQNLYAVSRHFTTKEICVLRDVPDVLSIPEAINLGLWVLRMCGAPEPGWEVPRCNAMYSWVPYHTHEWGARGAPGHWRLQLVSEYQIEIQAEGPLPQSSAIQLGLCLVALDIEAAKATGLLNIGKLTE